MSEIIQIRKQSSLKELNHEVGVHHRSHRSSVRGLKNWNLTSKYDYSSNIHVNPYVTGEGKSENVKR